MSKFFSAKFSALTPYTPGEQPKDAQYVKLNTNESPFCLPTSVADAVKNEASKLQLYSDPESTALTELTAQTLGVKSEQVLMTNGSDEALNFAFMAFCDKTHPVVFPDVTYGFYPVFANLNGIPYETIALKDDFSIDYRDYLGLNKTIVIANPNAPTGLCLPLKDVEEIVKGNPNSVVIIDEAYVDFGGESAVSLIDKYDNLLVTQTFSKSRALAGGRLGMAIGCASLIGDLKTMKYSTNPYNVNRLTAVAGCAVLKETEWFKTACETIKTNRAYTVDALKGLGFTVLDSKANFVFAKSEEISGRQLYEELKKKGVLVRHFNGERIKEYNRITIGSKEQMDTLLTAVKEILQEKRK